MISRSLYCFYKTGSLVRQNKIILQHYLSTSNFQGSLYFSHKHEKLDKMCFSSQGYVLTVYVNWIQTQILVSTKNFFAWHVSEWMINPIMVTGDTTRAQRRHIIVIKSESEPWVFFSLSSSSMLFKLYRYQNSAASTYFTSGPLKKCRQYNSVVIGSQILPFRSTSSFQTRKIWKIS